MAVELLSIDFGAMEVGKKETIGACMESCYGSLSTDVEFLKTTSPSIFVYTLPSATIGEICIRHGLKGPVQCLMPAGGPGRQAIEEVISWLEAGVVQAGLCLYCDVVGHDAADAMKSTLDRAGDFWYACALYIERNSVADPGMEALLRGDSGIAEVCERLCSEKGQRHG